MQPLIIAHRGASADAKENTLAAFERAIAFGADMIEFDVRRTKDRVLVVYHDAELQQKQIRKLTYAELQSLDPDIPTLADAVDLCQGKVRFDVELKEAGYEKQVMGTLMPAFSSDSLVITSFHPFALRRVKQHYPDVKTGFLFGHGTVKFCKSFRLNAKSVRDRVREMRADFIAPNWQLLSHTLLSQVVTGDRPIWVWTVNDEPVMETLLGDRRIEGIITDRPDLGMQVRHASQNSVFAR
ncbi:MAG: hypothetical protein Fur0046_24970 [Cyanobacteria bacterium J069]